MKCGIEIHQRLDTSKLFCHCYANPSAENAKEAGERTLLTRRMRAVAGETGEVDPAAGFEARKGKEYEYEAPSDSSCLVECDEAPPFETNREAAAIALGVAIALHCKPVEELHVMRKTVLDGSAISGFQRTALLATDGYIETSQGRVGIQSVCIEEESAGIIEKNKFRLDRSGIPLVEVATDAGIKSGAHCRETAEAIGLLLRGARIQRGLGSIRQDVNVSIDGGSRVEIKGAQELSALEKIVDNEVARQEALIALQKKLKGVKQDGKIRDVTKEAAALKLRGAVVGVKLKGLAGMLKTDIYPGKRLGSELADYARAQGAGGIIHSDERDDAGLAKALGCAKSDAWAVCAGEDAERALEAVLKRAQLLSERVPEETRRADGEGSAFMRPLPGSARMYPETDVPPLLLKEITPEKILSAEERRTRFTKAGLNADLAEKMLRSPYARVFEEAVERRTPGVRHAGDVDATFVAATLLETLRNIKREGAAVEALEDKSFREFFAAYAEGLFVKAAAAEILKGMANGANVADAVEKLGLRRMTKEELRDAAKEGGSFEELMRKYRLRADPAELKEALGR
ncbi:Glutamyl-tRNA(Gln) amidotransferase subunit E [Candidatus Norongarragalina meridionalis]|nr:Glutamyl-tRNA(Gln) amidotransferase subunit E [Candidatus Norongarragalina meridionalis]